MLKEQDNWSINLPYVPGGTAVLVTVGPVHQAVYSSTRRESSPAVWVEWETWYPGAAAGTALCPYHSHTPTIVKSFFFNTIACIKLGMELPYYEHAYMKHCIQVCVKNTASHRHLSDKVKLRLCDSTNQSIMPNRTLYWTLIN